MVGSKPLCAEVSHGREGTHALTLSLRRWRLSRSDGINAITTERERERKRDEEIWRLGNRPHARFTTHAPRLLANDTIGENFIDVSGALQIVSML